MLKKILIGLGIASLGAGLSYYFYKEYVLIKSWEFRLYEVKLLQYSGNVTAVRVKFKIINVSNVEATISELYGSITVNGVYIGTVYQSGELAIPSKGYNLLSLDMQIDNSNLLNQLVGIGAQGTEAPVSIRIAGTLKVKSGFVGVTVPIDDVENYTVLQLFQGI